jgi:hypothetical protein
MWNEGRPFVSKHMTWLIASQPRSKLTCGTLYTNACNSSHVETEYLNKWNAQHTAQPSDDEGHATVADAVAWKFSKPMQNWLVKHVLDRKEVSKEMFKLATPYLESVRGATRDRLLEDAQEVANADEAEFEEQVQRLEKKQGSERKVRALRARRKRAIILAHVLQE